MLNARRRGRLVTGTMLFASVAVGPMAWAGELRVPDDYPTIQAAIDAAADGDTVLVARGVYHGSLVIAGKSVALVSAFDESGDPNDRLFTVLDGGVYGAEDLLRRDAVVLVEADAGADTVIAGFTIRNGDDGVSCAARVTIRDNRFVNNVDAIDYEGGGGVCRDNLFVGNQDDAIDLDLDCAVVVTGNEIFDSADDGIEIRLHDYSGPTLDVVIDGNRIVGSGEDGVQIIDYPGPSDRKIRIARNVIVQSRMAGVGVMSDGVTREDYRSAVPDEPILIANNTLVDNEYGVAAGGVGVVNNVFVASRVAAIKGGGEPPRTAHNLVWDSGAATEKFVAPASLVAADPLLDSAYRPSEEGPCVDAGVARLHADFPAGLLDEGGPAFLGEAPDIGHAER